MDAFRIIAIVKGQESADAFKAYINGLGLKEETISKISIFDLNSPFNQKGFHPALALHMLEYNNKLNNKS